jgi:CheY-like chemotaxis protein/HPt (histidine-containing phosphotransfer) domain-containing protein
VSDGEEALRALDQKPYGLLFADCHMPNLDGFGLVARIRDEELVTRQHIPIVALTADALSGTEARCLKAGMDDYLTKPVTLERLDQMVRRWLPRAVALRRSAVALPAPAPAPVPSPRAEAEPVPPATDIDDATATALPPGFVPTALTTSLGLSAEEVQEFLDEFLADADELIERLRGGLREDDQRAAFQAAHALAGAAANVGALALGEVAEQIEALCRSGALGNATSLLPDLVRRHAEAKQAPPVTA